MAHDHQDEQRTEQKAGHPEQLPDIKPVEIHGEAP
jgi:hypothetical protein